MNELEATQYITQTFADVQAQETQGWPFFFYGAERKLPFATIGTNDWADKFSDLSREGAFRVNVGVRKETYEGLFGPAPKGAFGAPVFDREYDFKAFDTLMPHPEYAQMYWVCVVNPEKTWERLKGLLAEGYALAKGRAEQRG
jgi:hypothetical protein